MSGTENCPDPEKVIGIVFARSDSARLPGKALLQIGEFTLIEHVLKRSLNSKFLNRVVLATTGRAVDDVLVDHVSNIPGVDVFRGDFENIALRALCCAEEYGADYFARINGDSPFLDTRLLDEGILIALSKEADLVTNLANRTYPYGISVEIIKKETFKEVYPCFSSSQREHITQYFYQNLQSFGVESLPLCKSPDLVNIRLTVDNDEDLNTIRRIVGQLQENVTTANVIEISNIYQNLKSS